MQPDIARCVYRIRLQHHCRWLQPAHNTRWVRPRPFSFRSYSQASTAGATATTSGSEGASASASATAATTAAAAAAAASSFLQPVSYAASLSTLEAPSPSQSHEQEVGHGAEHGAEPLSDIGITANPKLAALPVTCPGCGALSSDIDSSLPGYYSRTRKSVKYWFRATKRQAVDSHDGKEGLENSSIENSSPETVLPPVCDRCHDLLHNSHSGTSIAHPRIEDIADSIAESPFSRNHVYHVLDAADFPMSLVPSIISRLSLARPRTQNRRSMHKFTTKPTLSFIITRSDLLGPTKEKVDALMPYFRDTLRSALYSADKNMRLGNLHLVSAKRGWWTKEIKEDIWERGGGNWMVGKFNVGKSNLFEVLFPKASGHRASVHDQLARKTASTQASAYEILPESSLLPPPQPEVAFPLLPIVSSLPGTTASPIRVPFGNRKGELIDMPGLDRGNLDQHVAADHRLDLVMTNRPRVKQHTIKAGQSLLLGGGLIRITPLLDPDDPSTTMLAYPFVPIDAHVTSTEKAIAMQSQQHKTSLKSILAPGSGAAIASAGTIELDTDVTKEHAGPLLRASNRLSASKLPFQIYSTDLVIEGLGWLELVCQVRRRRSSSRSSSGSKETPTLSTDAGIVPSDNQLTSFKPFVPGFAQAPDKGHSASVDLPAFEVFTPDGKHVMKRRPMGAWMRWQEGNPKLKRADSAPRRSRR